MPADGKTRKGRCNVRHSPSLPAAVTELIAAAPDPRLRRWLKRLLAADNAPVGAADRKRKIRPK